MIKKNIRNYSLVSQLIVRIRGIKLRYYTIFLLLILLIASVGIGGIYYGTKLYGSEYSSVFSSFYRFFRPSFNIIGHYFKGHLSQPEELSIHLKHLDYQKLAYKRQEALILDRLLPSENDWVSAEIKHNDNIYKAKIR